MNRFTLRVQKIWKRSREISREFSPKLQALIDKYKLIKVGCIVGVGINSYYAYNGILDVIVLREVKKQIQLRKEFFYKRVQYKKEQVFALMKELQSQGTMQKIEKK